MKVLILGGDGYLGWPTAMKLSSDGHNILVVDNYSRRKIASDRNLPTLISVPNLQQRVVTWKAKTGREILVRIGDVQEYEFILDLFHEYGPDAVIHFAEQPSAPYSMAGYLEARYTLTNNLLTTLNVSHAVKQTNPEVHIVKLGTMGEYGTPNIDIEEGYLDIEHNGRKDRFLYPRKGGSLYHTTKIQDTDLLYFYSGVWGLRVTDLMQGPVYGMFTKEMEYQPSLATNFSYDEIFGTVLNRFVVQAAIGRPLAVYGSGTQKRGFLNIVDTLECIAIALRNPPRPGEMSILNQFTEVFSILDLAHLVKQSGDDLKLNVEIVNIPNPRVEKEDHYYNPRTTRFRELGLEPHLLDQEVLSEMLEHVLRYKDNVVPEIVSPKTSWN